MAYHWPHQTWALSAVGRLLLSVVVRAAFDRAHKVKWLQVSPLMRLYLTALGAKIGDDAQISELDVGAIDLVTIGAGASPGSKLKLSNARVEGNELIIGPITIGPDVYVGTSSVIEDNVVIGEGAALEDLTSLPSGSQVGAHEIWNGSPARHTGNSGSLRARSPGESWTFAPLRDEHPLFDRRPDRPVRSLSFPPSGRSTISKAG